METLLDAAGGLLLLRSSKRAAILFIALTWIASFHQGKLKGVPGQGLL
jgi:hypothetical protein